MTWPLRVYSLETPVTSNVNLHTQSDVISIPQSPQKVAKVD